jgi:predicted dehydrogenase
MLSMVNGMTVVIELAFARNAIEQDHYIQTMIFVEGQRGSAEIAPDYWLRVTTPDGTHARRHPPKRYAWGDPGQEVCMSAIVDCHRDLLACLRGECAAETNAADNIRTIELMEACYESAATREVVRL